MQQPEGPTAAEASDVIFELSKLLDCGLDRETLGVCVALVENGVNPEVWVPLLCRGAEARKGS